MQKLTKRICDAAKPRERQYILWCPELPRFGLRVRENGSRVFIAQFRVGGRTRVVTLGRYGVLTVDGARREALRVLGEVEKGGDPATKRDAARLGERAALTVAEVLEGFLARPPRKRRTKTPRRPKTTVEYRRQIDRFILPRLGRLRVSDVTPAHIERLHVALAETPFQANRVLALLGAIFSFAVETKLLPPGSNPCTGVLPYPEAVRERFLSVAELGRLGAALGDAERLGTETAEAVAAIRLLLFLGLRRSEVLNARWTDVNFERNTLTLRESKTGPRALPLNAPALATLVALPRRSEWVVPGREENAPLVNIDKPWRRIRTAAGLDGLRLHDLRHSFASAAVGGGETLYMTQALLGHARSETTARYSHLSDDPVRRASESTAGRIAAALEGRPDADVVQLAKRKTRQAAPKR